MEKKKIMDEGYEIVYIEKPEEAAWEIIGRGLQKFNVQHAGDEGFQRICFAVCSPNQEIVGGALGEIYGYRVFGELADFPSGHRRFFLTKELT